VCVTGRGGIGKTAMVCRLLSGLEIGRIPDVVVPPAGRLGTLPKPEAIVARSYDFAEQLLASQRKFAQELLKATAPLLPSYRQKAEAETAENSEPEGDLARITVGGIVYLSRNGTHQVDYPTLVADLLRLVPAERAQRLHGIYQDPQHSPEGMMLALLEALPAGDPVVVLLDNLESVMDVERETFREEALDKALCAVLTAPAHAVIVIATTRVAPAALLRVEPSRQRQLRLEEGLGSPDAEAVLRALDDDGRLGLRDAPDELLDGLRRHTRGFPRALEAVKAILEGNPTLSPRDLLERTSHLPEDQVVQVLVGEAYELLDAPAKQVMQVLAVYPAPVSAVGVEFLLRPVNPTVDATPILVRLVRRQLVRFQDGHYYLHPVDREYACGQLPPGSPGDPATAFTLVGLQARAADYYAQIRTPRQSWRTLEDVWPQLAEFVLRCDTGDYDTAANVLAGIDSSCLLVWGHYRTLVELHLRIHGRITDRTLNSVHLSILANCYAILGEHRKALDLHAQALAIFRAIGDRRLEGAALVSLGLCNASVGDFRKAVDLHSQALAISRDISDRRLEGGALASLGLWCTFLGDFRQAEKLSRQALVIAREAGERRIEAATVTSLGLCRASVGEYKQAEDLYTQALGIARDTGDRRLEGAALVSLGLCRASVGDYEQAEDMQAQALTIARDTGDRRLEGGALGSLGACRYYLGDYPQAVDLFTQALAIARDLGDRQLQSHQLGNLGKCHVSLGDYPQAIDLFTQALAITRDTGDIEPAAKARSGSARAHLMLADPAAALAITRAARERSYPTEEPALRLLAGLALFRLHRTDEAVRAFSAALSAADTLLALAESNVAALQGRALALSGLAAAKGDPALAATASEAFAMARVLIGAAGMAEDTRRLLDEIASHDRSGVLTGVRIAPDA
jgi:tetratricopeptide (TPR) repeat protein